MQLRSKNTGSRNNGKKRSRGSRKNLDSPDPPETGYILGNCLFKEGSRRRKILHVFISDRAVYARVNIPTALLSAVIERNERNIDV